MPLYETMASVVNRRVAVTEGFLKYYVYSLNRMFDPYSVDQFFDISLPV